MLSKSETDKNQEKVRQGREGKKAFVLHSCVCYLQVLIHVSIINVLNNLTSLLNFKNAS